MSSHRVGPGAGRASGASKAASMAAGCPARALVAGATAEETKSTASPSGATGTTWRCRATFSNSWPSRRRKGNRPPRPHGRAPVRGWRQRREPQVLRRRSGPGVHISMSCMEMGMGWDGARPSRPASPSRDGEAWRFRRRWRPTSWRRLGIRGPPDLLIRPSRRRGVGGFG